MTVRTRVRSAISVGRVAVHDEQVGGQPGAQPAGRAGEAQRVRGDGRWRVASAEPGSRPAGDELADRVGQDAVRLARADAGVRAADQADAGAASSRRPARCAAASVSPVRSMTARTCGGGDVRRARSRASGTTTSCAAASRSASSGGVRKPVGVITVQCSMPSMPASERESTRRSGCAWPVTGTPSRCASSTTARTSCERELGAPGSRSSRS